MRVLAKAGTTTLLAMLVLTLHKSSGDTMTWPVIAREVRLEAKRFVPRGLAVDPSLRFLAAWRLRSADRIFGGLSALTKDDDGFVALSDAGALVRLRLSAARIESLPEACGGWGDRRERDSESLVREPDGTLVVGIEARNVICRIAPDGRAVISKPGEMQGWPRTGGAESMTRLRNGALLAIAERPRDDGLVSPALLLAGRGQETALRYRPPLGFRPTDVAQLPGGALLVLNRRFEIPVSMPGKLVLIDRFADHTLSGRTVVSLTSPDLDQNFEGVAVSQARGRSLIWLISDDNFMPTQDTILLLFEYRPRRR
jgi:hypothetical protein